MIVRFPPRAWLVWLCVAATLMACAGCGKSSKPVKIKPPQIPAADANDLVQLIAATVASDNGGWYFTVEAMAESLSVPAPVLMTASGGAGRSASPLGRLAAQNVFTMTRGANTYQFQVTYFHSDQTEYATRDSASDYLEANVHVNGGGFDGTNGLTESTYGYHADSSYTVFNLKASHDTLEFSTIVDDSAFANVTSAFNPESHRLWYHLNFFDYTLRLLKNDLTTNPYPVEGEVNWIIEAYGMRSRDRNDTASDILAEARMTFNGTPTATFTLTDAFGTDSYLYLYSVNLKTGAIARLN